MDSQATAAMEATVIHAMATDTVAIITTGVTTIIMADIIITDKTNDIFLTDSN